jgi:hypothetical protein
MSPEEGWVTHLTEQGLLPAAEARSGPASLGERLRVYAVRLRVHDSR